MKIGDKRKVPQTLTYDPYKKRGEVGIVTDLTTETAILKFSDGTLGYYDRSIWEE